MKKVSVLLLIALMTLSCTQNDTLVPVENAETKMFYASVASDGESKTYLDAAGSMYWTADDKISLFCSTTNEQYRFTGVTGQNTGSFENLTTPVTPIFSKNYSVYPYSASNSCEAETLIHVELPATQQYAENSFGPAANTMVAVTEQIDDDILKFKNVCGFLMIKLYGGDIIKSIKLYGNNNEKIAGPATITAQYEDLPSIAMEDGATTSITLDCTASTVQTETSAENFTPFWIVVPPTTFTGGFTIEITNADDDKITISTPKSITIERNKVLKMSPVKANMLNSNDLLSFSLSDGVNTYNAFDISNGYVNVQVPNGTDMTSMVASFVHNGASVTVNDVSQTSGEDAHDFSDFVNPLTYVVTSKKGAEQSYIIRMFDLPIVFASTPNGAAITSKTVWTEKCTFKIRENDGTITDYGSTNLRGRGNASWVWYDKKPYAVKFDTKQEVLGMPAHKRWCLLMNEAGYYYSNAIGFELGNRTTSLEWNPRSVHVELFLNDEYKGLYTITEQIKVDKNRVDITEMSSSDIEGDAITGGYLITYDNTFDEVNKFHSQYYNMPVMFKEPDEDVLVTAQFNYLEDYVNNFEASLKDDTRFASREYLNYFDVCSYIDMWFVYETAGDYKWRDFATPRSVYFYKDRNKLMKAGPVWDFNESLFYKQSILFASCQYYGRLFQDQYFVSKVKEKWPEFKARVKGTLEYSTSIIDFLDELHLSIDKASKRDWDMWWKNGDPHFSYLDTPDEQYTLIHDGIYPKLDYLEAYINSLVVDYDDKDGGNEDVDDQDDQSGDFDFEF